MVSDSIATDLRLCTTACPRLSYLHRAECSVAPSRWLTNIKHSPQFSYVSQHSSNACSACPRDQCWEDASCPASAARAPCYKARARRHHRHFSRVVASSGLQQSRPCGRMGPCSQAYMDYYEKRHVVCFREVSELARLSCYHAAKLPSMRCRVASSNVFTLLTTFECDGNERRRPKNSRSNDPCHRLQHVMGGPSSRCLGKLRS